ncbi:MAG: FAD-binding oxidoreductase [Leptolyngbyaceae cyanobacterium CSU_1_4]|nr:FAD-binding oxidoreductase [Leptolyngbyaceae cyanobacterium CSU_1_4]
MKHYDWIVVGGGLAGSALSYELAKVGSSVLLLEQSATPQGATRYSYGGIAYWAGDTPMMRQLCQESRALHRNLSAELAADTEFREINLLLTIDPDRNPEQVAAAYAEFMAPPALLSVEAACALEPLLNANAIAAVLLFSHGHVSPEAMVKAYNQAFLNLGGDRQVTRVNSLSPAGVTTSSETYTSANIAICAGAMSRSFLQQAGLSTRLYYTHAEMIETPPLDLRLQAIVMPAEQQRFEMEERAAEVDALWDKPNFEVVPAILDVGVVQFQDGSLRIGQITRALTDLHPQVDAPESEIAMRMGIEKILPALKDVPGKWRSCLVAFSGDRLPLVGAMPQAPSIHLFSGFSNPFAILPPLARRFAQQAAGHPDEILRQMSPGRFEAEFKSDNST